MGRGPEEPRGNVLAIGVDDASRRAVEEAGWTVRSAGIGDDASEVLRAGELPIVLFDLRDAGTTAAMEAIGRVAAACEAPLVAILAQGQDGSLDALYAAGATHFLVAPATVAEVVQAVRFAARPSGRAEARSERRGEPADEREEGAARRWLARRIVQGRPVGVLLAALSRVDLVNAAYGRAAGDALIAEAGRRMGAAARSVLGIDPAVLRTGAAEFALMVEDASAERMAALAGRLGEALARPFVVEDTVAALGSRLGVALGAPADDAGTLMRRAGDALARARASDGATVHVADAADAAGIDGLAVDLHRALGRGEIDILFQPQVEIASGRIVGVEALARWEHRTRGALGAETLFAAAQRADLGVALSEHIQGLVLDRAARWPRILGGLRVSVNLTAADVARPGYAALFLERLDASGFPRGRLTVEITESGLMADLAAASAFLSALRGAGCRVAIDDFGTGYSSLAYLKTLPLDYLKIDRALARDIGGSPRDRVVVGGVVTMARSLGLGVIAEGVETDDQRALLAAAGCDLYQGFLTAGALDEAALVAMVEGQ